MINLWKDEGFVQGLAFGWKRTSLKRRVEWPSLNVNNTSYSVDVEPETPLLWVLRDNIGLTGAKYMGAVSPHAAPAPSILTASR